MKLVKAFITSIALCIPAVYGNPYRISDDRVRSLDITPVLGRGYSIMTDMYHSTCLIVEEVTTPSYNYDYSFTDLTSSSESEDALEVGLSASLSYQGVEAELSASVASESKVNTQSRHITATMKLERYYSSVREEMSALSEDAATLLDRQDYVGFFKACGPNYVRGIRRAQEVTAIFTFKSNSQESSTSFSAALQATASTPKGGGGGGLDMTSKSKHSSANSSLEIKIIGFGMGLNQDGAGTLVATSLEEYQEVMKFAFQSFTQNEDSHNIGMIYGIEVVPWVNNAVFQVAAKLLEENVEIPLPKSLLQRAINKTATVWDSDPNIERVNYKCKEPSFKIDKFGYCCEIDSLYDYVAKEYPAELPETFDDAYLSTKVCRPIRPLDKSLIKDNMSSNGEFIANLDTLLRYKMNYMATLSRCVAMARSLPERYDLNILKSQDQVKYDKHVEAKFTLWELKRAVDPLNDFGLVQHAGRELDEWVEMYYTPCLAAIYGSNVGTTPGTDPQYFMAYPWYSHDECLILSCMNNDMRWDRENGGCMSSVLIGKGSPGYDDDDKHCAKDTEKFETEECKYPTSELQDYHTKLVNCWNETIQSSGAVSYFVDHFCMPQLTFDKADDDLTTTINGLKQDIRDGNKCQA